MLNEKLSFTNHIKVKIQKTGIGINVIKTLNNIGSFHVKMTNF